MGDENHAKYNCREELKDTTPIAFSFDDFISKIFPILGVGNIKSVFVSYMGEVLRMEISIADFFEKLGILSLYTEAYASKKDPVNFRKFDSVFEDLKKGGLVTLHAMGNTYDEGLEECKDEAVRRMKAKEKVTGYCYYTLQSLFNMFEYDSGQLLLSYGSFDDASTVDDIGNLICKKIEETGFEVVWNNDIKTKIGICIDWDNKYIVPEK